MSCENRVLKVGALWRPLVMTGGDETDRITAELTTIYTSAGLNSHASKDNGVRARISGDGYAVL